IIRLGSHAGAHQNDGVAVARHNGAVGLFGNFSCFQNKRAASDIDRHLVRRWSVTIFRHESFPLLSVHAEILCRNGRGNSSELSASLGRVEAGLVTKAPRPRTPRADPAETRPSTQTRPQRGHRTRTAGNLLLGENAVEKILRDFYLRRLRRST